MHAYDIARILVELATILVLARAAGWAFTKMGQPAVVGEILAGILLGPSMLGAELSQDLFPVDSRPFLGLLASLGLVLFMFVVGLELDVSLIKGRGRVAASVSIASILLPFSLGIALAAVLPDSLRVGDDFWPFALFVGAAMSVTAFPVLARILTDRGMHRTETGGLALACAATDDILAWTLLAVVIAIGGGQGESDQWLVALAVPFALVALFVIRPQLNRLTDAYNKAGRLTPGILSVVLLGLLLFSAATEYLHVHFIFGAFLFGAIIPHEGAAALRHEILVRLEQITVLLLLPVFFLVSGLNVDLRGLSGDNLLQLLLILAVAIMRQVRRRLRRRPLRRRTALAGQLPRHPDEHPWPHRAGHPQRRPRAGAARGHAVHDDGDHGAGHHGDDRAAADPGLPEAADRPRHRRGRACRPRRRGDHAGAGRGDAGRSQHSDARGRLRPARRHQPGRDRRRRPRAAAGQLEMGSGLSDELAEMAETMERQQVLVRAGEEVGIPVRIIANPSADVTADLVALAEALRPQFLVAWTNDESTDQVVAVVDCPLVLVDPGTVLAGPLAVEWTPDPDGDEAVVVAIRLANRSGVALGLPAVTDNRRYQAMRSSLRDRGISPRRPRLGRPGDQWRRRTGRAAGPGRARCHPDRLGDR